MKDKPQLPVSQELHEKEYWCAVKDRNGNYRHYPVCKSVYLYIRQLESYIKYPEMSRLKEVYHERFNDDE